jgi:serine/threonine-protein kinase
MEGGADALVGSVLADRYKIVKLLGEGGMGRVYEAQHVNINKRLAIKVLRPEVTAVPSTVARFRQEARSASSIGHENIIEIEDFATLPDGTVYLAMEMLEGESLGDRMREPPTPTLSEAVDIMINVGRGLSAAHDKGIVHRDMKPENVFLAKKHGRVIPKILDFGIAKVQGGESGGTHLTQTGAIFGTPLYMSPEQAMGQALDHRADIYSTGVILYELAVGRVPFKADSAVQVLSQHITMAPEPPSKAAPGRNVPPELDAIILRAMAKDPNQRFQKMSELVDALSGLAQRLPPPDMKATVPSPVAVGKPSVMPSQMGASQLELPPQKSRTPLIIVAALVFVGLVAGGMLLLRNQTPPVVTAAPAPPVETKQAVPPPVEEKKLPPAPVENVEVVVSSVPPGAKVLRDGKLLVETPDAVKLPPGESWNVVLHKDGYVDQPKPIMVPVAPPRPTDALASAVEHLAPSGTKRVGPFYGGHANEDDEHSDWFMMLEAGKCYSFVSAGGPGVKELYVYLWGPNGKRVTDRREGKGSVILEYCAAQTAQYHFQCKVADGAGDYKTALYLK